MQIILLSIFTEGCNCNSVNHATIRARSTGGNVHRVAAGELGNNAPTLTIEIEFHCYEYHQVVVILFNEQVLNFMI